jgi:thiamine-monophosphate kinase
MLKNGGLEACSGNGKPCVARYLYPEPRVRMGLLVARNRAATAGMDLSDGLADGVRQIGEASGVGAIVDADALPIDPEAREWFSRHADDATTAALVGGDDYELLLAVRPALGRRLTAARRHGDVPLTRIGVCTADKAVVLKCGTGGEASHWPLPHGYQHFR